MKLNPKIIGGSVFMVALCVISLVLFFKFGLGFGSTTNITETVNSPDMSEKVSQSQNEQLSNSEETSSHNTNSWHINVGSGLLIMSLVIVVGGLYSIHKYYQKTSVRLAQERRLLQRQMGPQDHEQDRTEVEQSSIVSNDKHVQNFQNFPVPSVPNIANMLQYQNPYVENIESDMNNQFYSQMQRRPHWTERDQRVVMYNPIYPGFQSTSITGYPQPMDRPHPSAPSERLISRREEKQETETNRLEPEKEDDKKQLEALKRQNQLLVNKFQQLHDSIEADI